MRARDDITRDRPRRDTSNRKRIGVGSVNREEDFLDKADRMLESAETPQDLFDVINVLNVGMGLWFNTSKNKRVKTRLQNMVEQLRAIRGDLTYNTLTGRDITDLSGGYFSNEDPWKDALD